MNGDRRPRSVYAEGTEPDPRFSLANERTALAWMRTGMSVIAAGVALAVYAQTADVSRWVVTGAVLACIGGALIGIWSLRRWAHVESALRRSAPIPAPSLLLVMPLAFVPLALLIIAFALGAFGG